MFRTPPRRLLGALPALVAYLYALVAAPWLHAEHHARFGADHVHDESGTHALPGAHADEGDVASAHTAFHVDLAAIGLDEVASAGALTVDCNLAEFTLADCSAAEATRHAPRFGDAIVAHSHSQQPVDPTHGKGSLEHLGKALLCPQPVTLPPPSAPHLAPALRLAAAQLASLPATAPLARGPPA